MEKRELAIAGNASIWYDKSRGFLSNKNLLYKFFAAEVF